MNEVLLVTEDHVIDHSSGKTQRQLTSNRLEWMLEKVGAKLCSCCREQTDVQMMPSIPTQTESHSQVRDSEEILMEEV